MLKINEYRLQPGYNPSLRGISVEISLKFGGRIDDHFKHTKWFKLLYTVNFPDDTFWAIALELERKWAHAAKEKKISAG